jgi:release factor glutamine methyltransferase
VGTGSGCIAIAVAHYLPEATIDATDISAAALAVAAGNAERLGVAGRVHFAEGDLTEPLSGPYDALLANLPYVVEGTALAAEVVAQPSIALFGGAELVNRLLLAAPGLLAPSGIALLEVDPAISAQLKVDGFAGSKLHRDLGGHDRVLEAWI